MNLTIDITRCNYGKLIEIKQWLEHNVGHELASSGSGCHGIGWAIKYHRYDYSTYIDFIQVDIDDNRLGTMLAMIWL